MPKSLAIYFLPLLFGFLSCGDSGPAMSQEHQNIVNTHKALQEQTANWMVSVKDSEENTAELLEMIRKSADVDPNQMNSIMKHNQLLAANTGLLKKFQEMIDNHNEYIDNHENAALTPEEIKAQHARMLKNFEVIEKDMLKIKMDLEHVAVEQNAIRNQIEKIQEEES